jgi:hypothetical protein
MPRAFGASSTPRLFDLRETYHLRKRQLMGIAEFIIGPLEGRTQGFLK